MKNPYNSAEVTKILNRIEEGATSDEVPLNEILRLCMRLGKQLQNEQLVSWTQSELNGYSSEKELPEYRIVHTQVLADFSGPFGSGLRNAQIPEMIVEEEHRERLFKSFFTQPVAELEYLVTQGKANETLKSPWSGDVIAYYQQKEIYQGMTLSSAWRTLSKPSLKGILDTIRTRVLDFVLQIKDEIDIQEPQKEEKNPEKVKQEAEKISQVLNNTIYGGNISFTNTGQNTQYNIQIQPNDLSSLEKYLKTLGLSEELLKELQAALKKDKDVVEKPGPSTRSWLTNVMLMIGKGTISLATNAAGSLIASALMQYLGVSKPDPFFRTVA